MIKSVTVTNYIGDSIKLDLMRPELSGFAVKAITGLGAGIATINTTEVSTNDGGTFNSARLSSRNIVLSLEFLWKDSIEEVRQSSYKYFPIKKKVTLIIETDNRLAEIEGVVETNEPNIFSPAQYSDISIICPNPYFYSSGQQGLNVVVFSGIEPRFTFPFINNSLTETLLKMGSIQNRKEQVVMYNGDSEIGITISIFAIGPATNITIYNTKTREILKIDTDKLTSFTGSGIVYGDEIIISTVKGNKFITLLREGILTNILNCLDKKRDWFQIEKGDNIFTYSAETGSANLQFKIENRIIYEGV